MNELMRAAANELKVLVDMHIEKENLDQAARVLAVVEGLERSVNSNVVQMSGWESSGQQHQHQNQKESLSG